MEKNQKVAEGAAKPGIGWLQEKTDGLKEFYRETRLELQRVTWPTRKQVRATTIVVIATVFFFGGFFFVSDQIVSNAVNWIFSVISR